MNHGTEGHKQNCGMEKKTEIAHELRTSLTVMKESVSFLLSQMPGRLNKKQREILTMVKRNIDRFERAVVGDKKRC